MSEFAGYALDETMDAEDDRFLYRTGGMSDAMAYDLGIIDELGRYDHPPMFASHSKQSRQSCKHCGASELKLGQVPSGGWRLYAGEDVHVCDKYKAGKEL